MLSNKTYAARQVLLLLALLSGFIWLLTGCSVQDDVKHHGEVNFDVRANIGGTEVGLYHVDGLEFVNSSGGQQFMDGNKLDGFTQSDIVEDNR